MQMHRSETRAKLLNAAAALIQSKGYHGFSFHDLAPIVGVTSATIHYHFPTKADLVQELVRQHSDNFFALLGPADAAAPSDLLALCVMQVRDNLAAGKMCLWGMLAAEIDGIPEAVVAEVARFFNGVIEWLARVFARAGSTAEASKQKAVTFFSSLEGAMLLSRSTKDHSMFDLAANSALALLPTVQTPPSKRRVSSRSSKNVRV